MSTFFGAYISNISTSVSWGSGGTCTVTVVEDPIKGAYLNAPSIGTPIGVKIGAFYFGGVFQRISYQESTSGQTYDLIIESADKYLDGIQIILSDWNGQFFNGGNKYNPSGGETFTNQIYNVWNVFAVKENYSYGGIYGGSNINSAGFPALDALNLIESISSGNESFGGPARFGNHTFEVDLGELKGYINNSIRLQGPVQSLKSIIDECCDMAGLDYYIDVVDDRGRERSGTISRPKIYLRAINRGYQPNPGAVSEAAQTYNNSGRLISKNIGYEWSAPITQQLVFGGKATRMLYQDAYTTYPIWGKRANNTYVTGLGNDTVTVYSTPTAYVPVLTDPYTGTIGYMASLFELRMATGGKDVWENWKMFETCFGVERNGYNYAPTAPWNSKVEFGAMINRIQGGYITATDLQNTSAAAAQNRAYGTYTLLNDAIWNAVSKVANEYYGQVFLMELQTYEPGGMGNNVKWIQDDYVAENAWDISDSAWEDQVGFPDVAFYDAEGRMKGGCAWGADPRFDYSDLGSEWCTTPDGGIGTFKGSADKDIYWINDVPYIIVRTGCTVKSYDGLTTPDYGFSVLWWLFTGNWLDPGVYLTAGAQNVQFQVPPQIVPPYSWGIPQESNRYVWGPWYAWNNGSPGMSQVKTDESLRPETFGSESLLDSAGFAMASAGLAQASVDETGSIEIVGVPDFNVARQFGGGGPYINGININVGVDQTSTTYTFSSWTPEFGKLSQNNINRIKQIRKGQLAFAQNKRSQITRKALPQVRFEKTDLSILSQQYTRPSPSMIHGFFNQIANSVWGQGMQEPQQGDENSDVESGEGGSIGSQS